MDEGAPKGSRPKGSMAEGCRGEEEANDGSWEAAVSKRILKNNKELRKLSAKIASLTKEIAEIRQAANVDCNKKSAITVHEEVAGGPDEKPTGVTDEEAAGSGDEEAAGSGDEEAGVIPNK